jgi:phage-related minor tail protein
MAGPNVGYASLQIIPSMRGAQAAMAGQIAGPSAAVGKQAGGTMGRAMGAALKVGLGAAVAGLGAVAGLARLGGSFDDAFDAIRVGTGATGAALEDLKGSFKTVFSSVPTDMGSASQAVADLNTRLGLTGEPLEELSTQLLELSRITGTDLGSNIESVTRVFGDWGVSAEEQAGHLDALFRASQATGITVDTLSQQMVKYGAPLRQLGFDFDTTAGLLGKFEKEGVNAELVMGSMRIALGKMAREGIPAEEGLRQVVEQIANAGSASEANALALELFGARAGPDMAAAIREGRFDLGELYSTIANGEETILGAAEDTADFSEKWNVFKNQVLVGLEPLATAVFDAITVAMGKLSDWWSVNGDTITTGFNNLTEAISKVVSDALDDLSGWWDRNGETVKAAAESLASALKTAFDGIIEAGNFVIEHWDKFKYAAGVLAVLVVGHYVALATAAVISTGTQIAAFLGLAATSETTATRMEASAARMSRAWTAALGPLAVAVLGAEAINEATGQQANPNKLSLWDRLKPWRAFEGMSFGWPGQGGSGDFGLRRAHGGPVSAGMPYIVGDRFGINSPSAELFVPSQNGTILPYVPGYGGAGGSSSPLVGGDLVVQQLPGEDAGEATFRALRKLSMVAG